MQCTERKLIASQAPLRLPRPVDAEGAAVDLGSADLHKVEEAPAGRQDCVSITAFYVVSSQFYSSVLLSMTNSAPSAR